MPARHIARTLAEGFAYQGEPSLHRKGEKRGEPTAALPATAFVNFLQNHDQIGNRALGERLAALAPAAALEAALAVTLLAPSPPLMFMGDEWGARRAVSVLLRLQGRSRRRGSRGRRKEFAEDYARYRDEVPDPLSEKTVRLATLDWAALDKPQHRARLDLVQRLLATRQAFVIPRLPHLRPGHGQAEFDRRRADGQVGPSATAKRCRSWRTSAAASQTRPRAFKASEPVWGGAPPAESAALVGVRRDRGVVAPWIRRSLPIDCN